MKKTILLVDDNHDIREFARMTFELMGYMVIEAASYGHAMSAFVENVHIIDLVWTDYNLEAPQTGIDIIEAVKEIAPSMPIIMASGQMDDTIRAAASRAGASICLYKPFTTEELACALRLALATAPEKPAVAA